MLVVVYLLWVAMVVLPFFSMFVFSVDLFAWVGGVASAGVTDWVLACML